VTAAIAELAADYREAIASGELTGAEMAIISYNAAVARRRNGLCGECWPPCDWGYTSSMQAAALREATRGES
jgi:hypothetical protein